MMLRHRSYKSYHRRQTAAQPRQLLAFWNWLNPRHFYRSRDLCHKSFKNPYFLRHRLPKRTRALKTKLALGLAALGGILGIFIFHPYFDIRQIQIEGHERIFVINLKNLTEDYLRHNKFWIFKNRNIILVNLNKIEKNIKEKYSLQNLKTSTDWPNGLKIVLKEKPAKLILQNNLTPLNSEPQSQYYLIDAEGKLIQQINPTEINAPVYLSLMMLQAQERKNLQINETILAPATVEFLNFWQKKIPEKTKISLASAVLADEEGRVVNLITTEGWKIIVDRQNDWEKQLQVLTIFLRDKINDRSKLRYIDVRYENRSYYQ